MADERKHIDEAGNPLGGASPQDMAVMMDEFVAPQDIIGEDMANELQRVLDEAQTGMNGPVALVKPAVDETAATEEDGVFESPDEVLSAEGAALADEEVQSTVATAADVTRQIEKMNALIREAVPPPANAAPAARPVSEPAAAVDDVTLMDTAADAAAEVTAEGPAVAAASAAADDEILTLEQILRMSPRDEPPSPLTAAARPAPRAAAGPATPTTAPAVSDPAASAESLGQLDEFLAGRADHAVSDEFETVNDVLADDQAARSLEQMPEAPVIAATPLSPLRYATTGVDVDELQEAEVRAAQRNDVPAGGEGGTVKPAAPAAPAPPPAVAPPQRGTTPSPTEQRRQLADIVRQAAVVCGESVYRSCVAINRPLANANDSTRKIIGYAGLITVANAVLLLIGKLILG